MRVKVKNVGPAAHRRMRPRSVRAARGSPTQDAALRACRGAGLGRQVPGDGHGHRAPRLDGAVPEPGSLRPVAAEQPTTSGRTGSSRTSPTAIAAAYNDWMADFVPSANARAGSSAPPCSRPTTSPLRSTSWPATSSAASRRHSSAPASSTAGPGTTRVYDPIWREAERLGVPVCFHGGGTTYLKPDFSFGEHLDKLMLWHPVQPAARDHVRGDLLHVGRHPRTVPGAAGRPARGELLVGAVHALPPRRALGVDGQVRGAGGAAQSRRSTSCATASSPARPTRSRRSTTSRTSATTTSSTRPTIRTPTRSSRMRRSRSSTLPFADETQAQGPVGQLRPALQSGATGRRRWLTGGPLDNSFRRQAR